jgi:hypothetical protein
MRAVLSILLAVGACSYGQSVISAHSGVVQYTEGDVTIDNQAIHPKFAQFPDLKSDQVIATEEGRVELLLTPGVFLRLAENSSVRMVSNSLSDTRLAFLSGSALIEVAELLPNNAITFDVAGTPVVLAHKGLYRIDAGNTTSEPVRVRVYDGQARVGADSAAVTVRKGREVALAASSPNGLETASFDTKDIDAFYRWSARRTEYVSEANVASAHVANDPRSSGYTEGVNSPTGAWSWNPYFGMFTYMPGGTGMYMSPFGYSYYSPAMLQTLYIPSTASMGLRPGFAGTASPVSTAAPMSSGLSRPAAGAPGGGLRSGGMPRH